MRRKTVFAVLMGLLFMLAGSLVLAQDLAGQRSPVLPSEILGPQLIAWSQLQKPQPVLVPLVAVDRPVAQHAADQRAGDQQRERSQPPATQLQQPPATQTVSGTIVKDGNRYVLKAADGSAYQLDDQEKAKDYEGKSVKISGSLDASGKSFHVASIELIS